MHSQRLGPGVHVIVRIIMVLFCTYLLKGLFCVIITPSSIQITFTCLKTWYTDAQISVNTVALVDPDRSLAFAFTFSSVLYMQAAAWNR